MRVSAVTRPPIDVRRDVSSAPQRSTAALSAVGDSRRTSASMVSSSQSCSFRQKSRRYNWLMIAVLAVAALLAQQPPVPQPFPRPSTQSGQPPRPAPPPVPPAEQPAAPKPGGAPTEAMLGVPIYPGAQFITSYDAGRGQRYYIFGSAASFVELVSYYRTALKQKGELVYEIPATHAFDVGRYNEDTMAFPPGVTIKDYESEVSQGYPNPKPGGALSDGDPDRAGQRPLIIRGVRLQPDLQIFT